MRIWCVLLLVVTVVVAQGQVSSQEVIREKRTVQYLVNHFAQFFGMSNPGKASEKQDIAGNPLKHILMASSAQFSGGSGGAKKSATPKPFVKQYEIPSQPERLVQEPSAASSGPSRVELLDSAPSTEAAPEPATTESTTTTTTEAPEPAEEHSTEPSTTNTPATDEPPSGPETTTVDPAAVNTLANNDAESRDDNTTQTDDNSIQTSSNYGNQNQQQQQYQRPAWNPFGHTSYNQLPYTTYFGNNVFLPAPFIPQPFSHFGAYQQQHQLQQPYQQQYHNHHAAAANLIPAASSMSHSRVKMHDQPYDLVTYHGRGADSVSSPSTYQVHEFGKPFARRY